ncbi:MAG: glycosyltransferase family 39 protein [Actinomycetota bacterium]
MQEDATGEAASASNASRNERLVVVAGLLALGGYLRASLVAPETAWFDDAWVAYAHRAPWGDLTEIALGAPGFSILLRLWSEVVGFGTFRIQFIPLVAALAAPPLAYWLLRRRTGLVAALAGALWIVFSPVHLVYSGRIKQYSLDVVFSLLIVHLSWRAIESPDDRSTWRNLALVSAVAVSVSFPLVLVAAPACAVPLLASVWRSRRVELTHLWLTLPLVTAPLWYVIVIRHRQYPNLIRFWSDAYVQTDAGLLVMVESILGRVADVAGFLAPGPFVVSVALVGGLIAWALRAAPLQIVVPLLTFAGAGALALDGRAPLGGGRTDLYLLGGLVLAAGLGFDRIVSRSRTREAVAGVAIAVLTVVGLVTTERPDYPDQRAGDVIAEIEARRTADDQVLVYHNAKFAWLAYTDVPAEVIPRWAPYGIEVLDPAIVVQPFPPNQAAVSEVLDRLDADVERVWLFGTDLRWSWQATIDVMVADGWAIAELDDEGRGRMVLFERSSDAS